MIKVLFLFMIHDFRVLLRCQPKLIKRERSIYVSGNRSYHFMRSLDALFLQVCNNMSVQRKNEIDSIG